MKKVLSIVLSIAMVLCMMPAMAFAGTATASQAAAAYSDTVGTPCEGAVNVLSALGVVNGYTDGTYKPEQVVTRAEMAKLIVTALGVDKYATATTSKFTDMGAASWAIPYVEYASNLNIVNGYGYGLFGPNDTVTYEQAVTMIVRALGYTDACNEMNGTWPAIYVQKATALGLFEDVVNGGSKGADRGDVAIMLYNALEVPEVYADNEGATLQKKGKSTVDPLTGAVTYSSVTMMDTLNQGGTQTYGVLTAADASNAKVNVRDYIGAAGKITKDKNGDVIGLGDIKSTFYKGTLKSDGKIEISGTKYTIDADAAKGLNQAGTPVADEIQVIVNDNTPVEETVDTFKARATSADVSVTIAAELSGTTIKKFYSARIWNATNAAKVEESDLAQITTNKKLLGYSFIKDDSAAIDTDSFDLLGVDTLDSIEEDNVVLVYCNSNNEIVRVTVGTKTVEGEITKVDSGKYTIDGTVYKKSPAAGSLVFSAGDEVKLWLDYDGKYFDGEETETSAGNFAVLMAADYAKANAVTGKLDESAIASAAKVQLYTADGAKVYSIKASKFNKNIDSSNATPLLSASMPVGSIIKYSVDDSGYVTKLIVAGSLAKYDAASADSAKVTKAGYLDGHVISDGAFIVSTKISAGVLDWSDEDDVSLASKSQILDSTITKGTYVYDTEKKSIVALVLDDSVASDASYGVVSAVFDIKDAKGVDILVNGEKLTSKEVEGAFVPGLLEDATLDYNASESTTDGLYKISVTAGGKYKFETVTGKYTVIATDSAVKVSNNEAEFDTTATKDGVAITSGQTNFGIASNVQVYVYDVSDDEVSVGLKSDLNNADNSLVKAYVNKDSNKDNYGLIEYVVIIRA